MKHVSITVTLTLNGPLSTLVDDKEVDVTDTTAIAAFVKEQLLALRDDEPEVNIGIPHISVELLP